MGVYIPGIKPPKDEPGVFRVIVMYVGADGKLRAECEGTHEAVLIPKHGRLIDKDAIRKKCERGEYPNVYIDTKEIAAEFYAAPTIIPAEDDTDFYTKGHLHLGNAEEGE